MTGARITLTLVAGTHDDLPTYSVALDGEYIGILYMTMHRKWNAIRHGDVVPVSGVNPPRNVVLGALIVAALDIEYKERVE